MQRGSLFSFIISTVLFSSSLLSKVEHSGPFGKINYSSLIEQNAALKTRSVELRDPLIPDESGIIANSNSIVAMYNNMISNVGTTDTALSLGEPLTGEYGVTIPTSWFDEKISWHPSGKYLAVSGIESGKNLHIYSFDSTNNTFKLVTNFAVLDATKNFIASWSSDGKYIAGGLRAANGLGSEIACFSFDGEQLTELEGCRYEMNTDTRNCYWSPDGKWFSTTGGSTSSAIFKFDGVAFERQVGLISGNLQKGGMWSPNGKFFAISGVDGTGKVLEIYSWDDGILTLLDTHTVSSAASHHMAWSQDGRHIAVSLTGVSTTFKLFRFDGASLELMRSVEGAESPGFALADSFDWSKDSKYLFVGFADATSSWASGIIKTFKLEGENLTELKHLEKSGGGSLWVDVHPKLPLVATLSYNETQKFKLWRFDSENNGKDESLIELSGCGNKAYSATINNTRWSLDGRYLAFVSDNSSGVQGGIFRFEYGTMTRLFDSNINNASGVQLMDASWHPSGKYLAYVGFNSNPGTSISLSVSKFDGVKATKLSGCDYAYAGEHTKGVAWHPSGKYLAISGGVVSDSVKCFKFENEALTVISGCNFAHGGTGTVNAISWHPSGAFLAMSGNAGGDGKHVRILKFTGTAFTDIATFDHGGQPVNEVKWSPSGKFLLISGNAGSNGNHVRILEFSGSALALLTSDTGDFTTVDWGDADWAPDEKSFVTTSGSTLDTYTLHGFDGTRTTTIKEFTDSAYSAFNLKFHPSGDYVSFNANNFQVLPLKNRKSLQGWASDSETEETAITSDISVIQSDIGADSNATAVLKRDSINKITGYQSLSSTTSNLNTDVGVNSLAWTGNGKYLALGTDDLVSGNQLRIFKNDGSTLSRVSGGGFDFGLSATIKDVSWHPDGSHVAVAADVATSRTSSQISVFELTATGINELATCYKQSSGQASNIETVEALDWSPDGKFLVVAGFGPTSQAKIYGFDFKTTLSELSSLAFGFGATSTIYDVAWHPDGKHIAFGGDAGAENNRIQISTLEIDQYSLDGYAALTCTNGTYADCETRYGVAWSPDGTKLAAVGGTGFGGAEVMAFDFYPTTSVLHHIGLCDFTHGGTVASATWSPDSQYLSISGYTGSAGAHSRTLKFKDRAFDEVEFAAIKNDDGIPVRYGDAITFKHKATGKFLQSNWLNYWQAGTPTDDGSNYRKLVSAVGSETTSSKWMVKGPVSGTKRWNCDFGKPLLSGDTVQIECVENASNLITLASYDAPISANTPYYSAYGYQLRANGPGVGSATSAEHWKITVVGGADGDIVAQGDQIKFESPAYTSPQYYLYSHDVDFETIQSSAIYEQEVAAVNLTDGNEIWTVSAVDAAAYKDATADDTNTFVSGGASGGAARSISYRPDGLALSVAGGLDNQGSGLHIKPFEFESLKSFDLGQLKELRLAPALSGVPDPAVDTRGVAWSPDGLHVAITQLSATDSLRIYSFNGTTATEVDTYSHGASLYKVTWNPDGKHLAVSGDAGTNSATQRFLKFENQTITQKDFGVFGGVDGFSWHPSGRVFSITYSSGIAVYRFDKTQGIVAKLADTKSLGVWNKWTDWSADGKYLATGGPDYGASKNINVYRFDLESGLLTDLANCNIDVGFSIANGGAWSPSGKYLAVACYTGTGKKAHVYKFENEKLTLLDSLLSDQEFFSVDWSKDEKYLAFGGPSSKSLRVLSFDGNRLSELVGSGKVVGTEVRDLSFSPDNNFVAAVGVPSEFEIFALNEENLITSNSNAIISTDETFDRIIANSNSVDLLATNSSAILFLNDLQKANSNALFDQAANIFELTLGDPVDSKAISAGVRTCGWSPDGKYVAIGQDLDTDSDYLNLTIRVYEFDGSSLTELEGCRKWHGANVQGVKWSPDGQFLAICGPDSGGISLRVYKFANRVLTQVATGVCPAFSGEQISWHPTGNFIVGGRANDVGAGEIILFSFNGTPDSESLTALNNYEHGASVLSAEWSPDGNTVLIVGYNGASSIDVRAYSFNGTNSLTELPGCQIDLGSIFGHQGSWHPTGKFVAITSWDNNDLYIYSFSGTSFTLVTQKTFGPGYAGNAGAHVSWSNDGLFVILSSEYVTADAAEIRVYRFDGKTLTEQIRTRRKVTPGSGNHAHAAYFSPDDKFVAAVSAAASGALAVYPAYKESAIVSNSNSLDKFFSDDSIALGAAIDTETVAARMNSCDWHPTDKYVAIGFHTASSLDIKIYKFDGAALTALSGCDKLHGGAGVTGVVWSPNGEFLAICGFDASGTSLRVYRFENETLTEVATGVCVADLGQQISWHPSGNFIVGGRANDAGGEVVLFSFDGTKDFESLTALNNYEHGASVRSAEWSPDGNYVLIVGADGTSGYNVRTFSFNGTNALTELTGCRLDIGTSWSGQQGSWHPEGKYVALAAWTDEYIHIYKFDGTSLTFVTKGWIKDGYAGNNARHVSWSRDGKFCIVSQEHVTAETEIRVFNFEGLTLTEQVGARVDVGEATGAAHSAHFSHDDRFVAVSTYETNGTLAIYPVQRDLSISNSNALVVLSSTVGSTESLINANLNFGVPKVGVDLPDSDADILSLIGRMDTAEPVIYAASSAIKKLDETSLPADSNALLNLDILARANSNILVANSQNLSEIVGLNEGIPSPPTLPAGARDASWSPSGRYCAVGNTSSTGSIKIYKVEGSAFTEVESFDHGAQVISLSWHPTGNFLAASGAVGTGSKSLHVFSFENENLTEVASHASGNNLYGCHWNYDGTWLATGELSTGNVYVYSFNSITKILGAPVTAATHGVGLWMVKWSFDGKHILAAGHDAGAGVSNTRIRLYSFNSTAVTLTEITACRSDLGDTGSGYVTDCTWGVWDDNYFALASYDNNFASLKTFYFDGSTITQKDSILFDADLYGVSVSNDKKTLYCGGRSTNDQARIYKIEADGKLTFLNKKSDFNDFSFRGGFSPSGSMLAVTGGDTTGSFFEVYPFERHNLITSNSNLIKELFELETTTSNAIVALGQEQITDSNAIATQFSKLFPAGYAANSLPYNNSWAIKKLDERMDVAEPQVLTNSSAIIALDVLQKANSSAVIANSWAISQIIGFNEPISGVPTIAGGNTVNHVVWSPDGKYCATVDNDTTNQLKVFRVDGNDVALMAQVEHGPSNTLYGVTWHKNGNHISTVGAAGAGSSTVVVYKFENETLTSVGTDTNGTTIYGVDFSPDGAWLLVGSSTGTVDVYAFDSSNLNSPLGTKTSLPTAGLVINKTQWSPSGSYFAVAASGAGKVYSFNSGTPSATIEDTTTVGGATYTQGVAWLPGSDGVIFTGNAGGFSGIKVYDFDGSALTEIQSISGDNTIRLESSSDRRYLVAATTATETTQLYRLNGQTLTKIFGKDLPVTNWLTGFAFNPAENMLAVAAYDTASAANRFRILPVQRESLIETNSAAIINIDELNRANSSAIVKHSGEIYPGGYGAMSAVEANSHAVVDLDSREITNSNALVAQSWKVGTVTGLNESLAGLPTISSAGREIEFSPSGKYCALTAVGAAEALQILKVSGNSFTQVALYNHGAELKDVKWHSSGKYLAVAGVVGTDSKTLRIFRFENDLLTEIASYQSASNLHGISWHPNGAWLASAESSNGNILLFSFNENSEVFAYTALTVARSHSALVNDVAWTPSGEFLMAVGAEYATDANTRTRIYSFVSSGPSMTEVTGGRNTLGSTNFGTGCTWNVSGQNYCAVSCDLGSFNGTKTFLFNGATLTEKDSISETDSYRVASSSDGKYLYVGSTVSGGSVKIYRADFDAQLTEIASFSEGTSGAGGSFKPDNSVLATVGAASFFKVYPIARDSLLANNSWAIESLDEPIAAQSSSIVKLNTRYVADSNAIATQFSNIFPGGYGQVPMIEANSNLIIDIVEREAANSSAIKRISDQAFPNGLGQISLNEANSNSLYANSWAIQSLDLRIGTAETNITSNDSDIVGLDTRVTTNENDISTQAGQISVLESQASSRQEELSSIDSNLAHLWFDSNKTLSYDVQLSGDHKMYLSGDLTLNCDGHVINFPRSSDNVLDLSSGVDLVLTNGLINRFSEANVNRQGTNTLTFGTGAHITLADDENLSQTWKFSGAATLDGKNKTLDLSAGGRLEVLAGGKLTLRNMHLNGILNDNLSCADGTASIEFRDVELGISNSYHFGAGSFEVGSQLSCVGGGIFSYESVEASTIASGAIFEFGPLMTFSYSPTNTFDNRLIFTDSTSQLHLDQATLKITSTGLEMHSGTLRLSHKNYLEADEPQGQSLWAGLKLGTGLEYQNLSVHVNPGGSLEVKSGLLDYKNVEGLLNDVTAMGSEIAADGTGFCYDLDWHHENNYLAAAFGESGAVKVFWFDGTNLVQKGSTYLHGDGLGAPDDRIYGLTWNPDGVHIAIAGEVGTGGVDAAQDLRILKFENDTLTYLVGADVAGDDATGSMISWRATGDYLAVGRIASGSVDELQVYKFDKSTPALTLVSSASQNTGQSIGFTGWSPDGKYLITGGGSGELDVYYFNNLNETLTLKDTASVTGTELGGAWSSYGDFIACTSDNSEVKIYSFDRKTEKLSLATSKTIETANVHGVSWSKDSRYVSVANDVTVGNPSVRIYWFTGNSLTQVAIVNLGSTGWARAAKFNSSDESLAVCLSSGIKVYKPTRVT
jgi:WD40 repeat protein